MKTLLCVAVLTGACGMAFGSERTVIVPKDEKPFVVEQDNLIRLTGKGIAGSKIEVKIAGPAKLEATNNVRELTAGRALIGSIVKEFELKPTDKGKVTATITVKPPQPDAKATVSKYEFEVQ